MSKKNKLQIVSVRIEQKPDESPDLSFLGTYTNKPIGVHLDRITGELRDDGKVLADNLPAKVSSRSLNFIHEFQHDCNASVDSLVTNWGHVSDKELWTAFSNASADFGKYNVAGCESAQTRQEKIRCLEIVYCIQDALRLESYEDQNWQMLGIIAKAEIRNPQTDCLQTIRSGGIWGVESDAGDYLKEVARGQLSQLKAELLALNNGIGERAIEYAIKNCKP